LDNFLRANLLIVDNGSNFKLDFYYSRVIVKCAVTVTITSVVISSWLYWEITELVNSVVFVVLGMEVTSGRRVDCSHMWTTIASLTAMR